MIRSADARAMGMGSAVSDRPARRARSVGLPVEILGLLYFIVILGLGLMLVWQPARVTQVTSDINRLEAGLKDLKLKNEDLKKTVAGMESLDYVESLARGRLGMVDPAEIRTCEILEAVPSGGGAGVTIASTTKPEETGIMSVLARIVQIFGGGEATAKEQR